MAFFPRKILLATDGSVESLLAIRAAAELAQETGSELHVTHVGLVSPWVHPDTLSGSQYMQLRDRAQTLLDKQVKEIEAAGATVAAAHLRMGRSADEQVIHLSEEIDAGLIVVGSRGEGTFRRALMGSDAESIVRHSRVPVLVIRGEDEG